MSHFVLRLWQGAWLPRNHLAKGPFPKSGPPAPQPTSAGKQVTEQSGGVVRTVHQVSGPSPTPVHAWRDLALQPFE